MRQLTSLIGCVCFAASWAPVEPSIAQAASAPDGQRGFVCMVRERPGSAPSARVAVIVAASEVARLRTQAYSSAPCEEAFGSAAAQAAWREEMCVAAALQPDGFKAELERLYGFHPATLCAMAEPAYGPWRRGPPRVQ